MFSFVETLQGVTINLIDEKTLSIFAPNEMALADAEEIIKTLLEQKVIEYLTISALKS